MTGAAERADAIADRRHTRLLLDGRCQDCGGRAAAWCEKSSDFMFTPTTYYVNVTCGNCGNGFRRRTPGQYLLADPTVTEYADEHGIDLYERPQWAYEWARSDYWTVVRSEEPLLLEQHAIVDGCRLVAEIAVDEDHFTGVDGLRFVEVTRVDHVPLDGVPDDAPGGAVRGDRAASASDRPTIDRSAVDE